MNKLLSNLFLLLSITSSFYFKSIPFGDDIPGNHKEIVETIKRPLQLEEAIREIIKQSGTSIDVNQIIEGFNALKSTYPNVKYFKEYFALRLDNADPFSITNQFFDLLKEFRKKKEIENKETLYLFGQVRPKDIIARGVLNDDVFLVAQDEDGLALLLTFSRVEPKIIFTIVRAEWEWGSSWWGDFNGFSYFSYAYNTQTKTLNKHYSDDKFIGKNFQLKS